MEVGDENLKRFFSQTLPLLDERERRLMAAAVVEMCGRGGQAMVSRVTHMSRNTLITGAAELADGATRSDRVRRPGAGRKAAIELDPEMLVVLDSLVEPESRGDPMSPLRWTAKSTRTLAGELTRLGHQAGSSLVGRMLHYLGYSLQANAKVTEGAQHPDRDAQFRHINTTAAEHLAAGQPVISVDCKKKELVGDYANGGAEWEPAASTRRVGVHDFPDPEMGKAIPYGVFDIAGNQGWVNVGDHHDTPAFAVASIARWWERMGRQRYPDATRLMITADAGGSNSYRSRAFKTELAKLATTIGLIITVCHMPPGTSKWNRIEHRLFSFISMNWRGKPLTTYRTVVELIAATTTRTGLTVQADFDEGCYPTGIKISDAVPIKPHELHPNWNYSILPTPP
ncbi:MAG: ISAzo13 family transposase [Acidimicrobiales bacterium]